LQLLEQTAYKLPNLRKSAELLSAHSAMTHEIAKLVKRHVGRELVNVEEALDVVICDWVGRLQRLDNEYFRQREQDVRDAGRRMTRYLAGSLPWSHGPLPFGSIVVAKELLPSEAIELANCGVAAIVSERGGRYSHTAIVARSMGIPAVTEVHHATTHIRPGMHLLVDAQAGSVTLMPTKSAEESFENRMRDYETQVASLVAKENVPCTTQDGIHISLLANIGQPQEIEAVAKHSLAGVGLFRTEFLFLGSHERPTVQAQVALYDAMAKGLNDQQLVIRTFDIGGDKIPPFLLSDQAQVSGSLQLRGLRFLLAERNLLDEQLRAILHVAQTSDLRILFPMVIGSDDLAQAIAAVDRIVDRFSLSRTPPLGVMIETPAALYALDEILDLADFAALGTNDLTQYMLATDRDLAETANECTAMHPAVLRAIKQVVDSAETHQCPLSVCGEEAGDADFACLLVGLGIRELSLSSERGTSVREALRGINTEAAAAAADQALRCRNPREVRELLAGLCSRVQI
jgi:phosphoenolpyruvate-protein phosphotransferase